MERIATFRVEIMRKKKKNRNRKGTRKRKRNGTRIRIEKEREKDKEKEHEKEREQEKEKKRENPPDKDKDTAYDKDKEKESVGIIEDSRGGISRRQMTRSHRIYIENQLVIEGDYTGIKVVVSHLKDQINTDTRILVEAIVAVVVVRTEVRTEATVVGGSYLKHYLINEIMCKKYEIINDSWRS